MAWSDTAELYWQFIGPDWEDDSEIVGVLVRFDGAADSGVAALAGGNLRAWGHGPLDGSVTLDAAEPLVMLDMPRVAGRRIRRGARRLPDGMGAGARRIGRGPPVDHPRRGEGMG